MMEDQQPVPLKKIKLEGEHFSTFNSCGVSEFPFFTEIKTEIKEEIQTTSEDVINDIFELQVEKRLSGQPTLLPQDKAVSGDLNLKIDRVFYTDERLIYKLLTENSKVPVQNGVSLHSSKNSVTVPVSINAPTKPVSTNAPTMPVSTKAPTMPVSTKAPTMPVSTNAPTMPVCTKAPTMPASSAVKNSKLPDKYTFAKLLQLAEKKEVSGELNLQIDKVFSTKDTFSNKQPTENSPSSGKKGVSELASNNGVKIPVSLAVRNKEHPDKYDVSKILQPAEKKEVSGELDLQIDKVFSTKDTFSNKQCTENSASSGKKGVSELASNNGVKIPVSLAVRNKEHPDKYDVSKLLQPAEKKEVSGELNLQIDKVFSIKDTFSNKQRTENSASSGKKGVSVLASNNGVKIPVSLAVRNKEHPDKYDVSKLLKLAPKVAIPSQLNNIIVQNSLPANFNLSQNHSAFLTYPVNNGVSQKQFSKVQEPEPLQIIVLPNFNIFQTHPSSTPPTYPLNNYNLPPKKSAVSDQNGTTVPASLVKKTIIPNNCNVSQLIKLAPKLAIPPRFNNTTCINSLQTKFLPAHLNSSQNHRTLQTHPTSKALAHSISNGAPQKKSADDNDSELQTINPSALSLQNAFLLAKINSPLLTQPFSIPSPHPSNNSASVLQKQSSDSDMPNLHNITAGPFQRQSNLLTTVSKIPISSTPDAQKSPVFIKSNQILLSNGTYFPLLSPASATPSTLVPSFLQADVATVTSSTESIKLLPMKPENSPKITQENSMNMPTLKNVFFNGISKQKINHERRKKKRKLHSISCTTGKPRVVVGLTKAISRIFVQESLNSLENCSASSMMQNTEVFTAGTSVYSGDENLLIKKSHLNNAKAKSSLTDVKAICDQTIDKGTAIALTKSKGLGISSSHIHQNPPSCASLLDNVQNENVPKQGNMSVLKATYSSDINPETLRPCAVCLQKITVGLNETVLLQRDTSEASGFKYYVQKDIFFNSGISTPENDKLFQFYGENSEINKLNKSAFEMNENQVPLDELSETTGHRNVEDLDVKNNLHSINNDYNCNRKSFTVRTTLNGEKTKLCENHAEKLDHYSSESDSDMFGESSKLRTQHKRFIYRTCTNIVIKIFQNILSLCTLQKKKLINITLRLIINITSDNGFVQN
ncbi:hypothetical protein Btru_008198 [Bulinus truncatus]|nr:hypothetical protein Btru_008198 [Bulinus truncatus]